MICNKPLVNTQLLFALVLLAACGSDTNSNLAAYTPTPAPGPIAGTTSTAGAAASPPILTTAGVGPAVTNPIGAAGSPVWPGTTAGTGGAAGMSAGKGGTGPLGGTSGMDTTGQNPGTAGTADKGGTGGAAAPSGNGIMRGPDPTEQTASKAGTFKVKTYTSGFKDGMSFGGGTIYYPTDADAPFASAVFCPGWLAVQSQVAAWGPFLASHGFVLMIIDTNATGDSVDQRSTALLDALESLKGENTRSGGPLVGKMDLTRIGLMGWSMGGGGTWIDASKHPELKSAVTMAGHIATAPGNDLSKTAVPTLMIAGTGDNAILGLGMSQPVYEAIPDSTPKMLYEITGAGHFDFNDPAFNSWAVGRYALSWQKVFLEGDMRYRKFLMVKGPGASDFRTNVK
jgi:dienelactone hydrolase